MVQRLRKVSPEFSIDHTVASDLRNAGSCSAILREVSSNENLDRVGRLHGIDRFVNKNPSQGNEVPFNIMTATVEAILGAVWLDSQHDLDAVRRVMGTLGLVPAGITSAISSASQS